MKYMRTTLALILSVTAWEMAAFAAVQVAYISDHRPSGTNGGTCTSGSWIKRSLNTKSDPSGIVVTLASNQFTLNPGTYDFSSTVPAGAVNQHKAKLFNATDGVDVLLGSSQVATLNGGSNYSNSGIYGMVTINKLTTFEIQHQCAVTRVNDGFGSSTGLGVDEVYTQLRVTKLETSTPNVAYIYDRVASGTSGGFCTGGIWTTRRLTTLVNPAGIVSISAPNQFTLNAGTYNIGVIAPMGYSNQHQVALYDVTNGATVLAGSSELASGTWTDSNLYGTFTIASPTTFEIVHLCAASTIADGLGSPSGFGVDEVFTQIKIDKI